MIKKITVFTILVFLYAFQPAQADELKCYTHNVSWNAIFSGVDRVSLTVKLGPVSYDQSKIPAVLRKDSLEKKFQKLYIERLKLPEDMEPNCYGRNNQPVEILDYFNQEDRVSLYKQAQDPAVLTVYIHASIYSGPYVGYPEGEDFMVIRIDNLRADTKSGTPADFGEMAGTLFFPLSMKEDHIMKNIDGYFRGIR